LRNASNSHNELTTNRVNKKVGGEERREEEEEEEEEEYLSMAPVNVGSVSSMSNGSLSLSC